MTPMKPISIISITFRGEEPSAELLKRVANAMNDMGIKRAQVTAYQIDNAILSNTPEIPTLNEAIKSAIIYLNGKIGFGATFYGEVLKTFYSAKITHDTDTAERIYNALEILNNMSTTSSFYSASIAKNHGFTKEMYTVCKQAFNLISTAYVPR